MDLPAQVIDPHIHQWDPLTNPSLVSKEARLLRWLPRIPRQVRRLLPPADREFAGDPQPLLKPYRPAGYVADTGDVHVRAVVHIEAAWHGEEHIDKVDETRWVRDLPWGRDGAPQLGAMVVGVDPRRADAGAVLDAHAEASPLTRGVRFMASHHDDAGVRDFADAPGILTDKRTLDGFAAVAERGLSTELWCYGHQLAETLPLVEAYPEATFVLDHHGTPAGALGQVGKETGRTEKDRRDILARWRDDIAALADRPNVVAKQSGLGMGALGGPGVKGGLLSAPREVGSAAYEAFLDAAAPLVRHSYDCFGAERSMWASNFPVDKPRLTLPATARLLLDALGEDADPQALFHDVAARTYRIEI